MERLVRRLVWWLRQRLQAPISAEFHLISGSKDHQTSKDVYDTTHQFQLPDPAGRAGGACTSALLKVLYNCYENENLTWVECLRKMRTELNAMGYDQIPELTSSRLIDVNKPMYIVPPGSRGKRRAVLIGVNYTDQTGELVSENNSGCMSPVENRCSENPTHTQSNLVRSALDWLSQ